MRRLWTDIVQQAQLPLIEMQARGMMIDEPRRQDAIAKARAEREFKEAEVLGRARQFVGATLPEMPKVDPCRDHPEFKGESPRRKCVACREFYGEMRSWRNSAAFRKHKRLQEFNVASDDHLRWLLFEALGLKPIEFTETGKPRVNIKTLEELKTRKTTPEDAMDLLGALVEVAHLDTLVNTFLSPPIGADGRVHPPLTLEGTSIGRVRSGFARHDEDKPSDDLAFNIQNIPERARHIYVADPGFVFVELDASKIEWILLMLLAGAQRADVAYRAGEDVHLLNARLIAKEMGVNWEELTDKDKSERRREAKRYTHGFDYGMMPAKAAKMYRLELGQARRIWEAYFKAWPEILVWQREIVDEALALRQLVNPFGRYRRFLDITSRVYGGKRELVLNEPNEAFAFKPASTNADIWKVNLRRLRDRGFTQVTGTHDSHLLLVAEDEVVDVVGEALAVCEEPFEELAEFADGKPWGAIFEAKIGVNWGPAGDDNPGGVTKWRR